VDADGLLSVSARESTTGVEAAIAVKPPMVFTDEQITQMLRDSFDHAKDDVHVRALREQRVEGERMLEATEAALREDADLLSKEESARAAYGARRAAQDARLHRSSHDQVGNRTRQPRVRSLCRPAHGPLHQAGAGGQEGREPLA